MENSYIDQSGEAPKKTKSKKPRKSSSKRVRKGGAILVQVLNGEILTRDAVLNNLGYVFFCIFLLILLVAKGYYGKQLTRDIDLSLKELNASTAEYVEAKARLEEKTKRSELVRILEPKGIKETTKPAKVIRVKK
ncbi:MAG: hypothetical protein EP338_06485 [Bacteroidetes bacterium]|nr:MAG: hypothetical protein EP338_06485 [Bacteroidota bacterium]